MELIASQQGAMRDVVNYLKEGHKRIVILGEAGTGKTFMTNALIYVMKTELYSYGGVHVTAPTHKALTVLKTKIDPKPYIHFNTIHSDLKLKREIDRRTGRASFVASSYNPKYPPFKGAQVVLVDETSMLGRELLFGEGKIEQYPNLTFIFIGDIRQLPPIGETVSPIFTQGWPTVVLTETVRQKFGSPILDVAKDLSLIKTMDSSINAVGNGYFFEPVLDHVIDKLAEVNGTDDIKYMAWANADVIDVNARVRFRLYGTPAKVELGETLIFNAPYTGDKGESYKNNEEILVESLEITDVQVIVPTKNTKITYKDGIGSVTRDNSGNYSLLRVKVYMVNGDIKVLHEDSVGDWNSALSMVISECKKFIIPWPIKFWFEEQLADISYNHAITVHKSQGSTYGVSIINVGNINFNPRLEEKQKMFYTAITRASNKVCFHNVTPRTLRLK